MRWRFFLYSLGLFVSFGTSPLFAVEFFQQEILRLENKVEQVKAACLSYAMSHATSQELVIVSKKGDYPNYSAELSIFSKNSPVTQGQSSWHEQRLVFQQTPPPYAFDFSGTCSNDHRQDLILLYPEKIELYSMQGSAGLALKKIVKIKKSFFVPEAGALPYLDLVGDFNGDGTEDFLSPMDPSLVLIEDLFAAVPKVLPLAYHLKSFIRGAPLNQPLAFSFTARQSHWIPEIVSTDYNGDGNLDLIFVWQDELSIFLQSPQRSFAVAGQNTGEVIPTVRRLGLLNEEDRHSPSTTATLKLTHFGSDPFVDILASRGSGSIADLKTSNKLILRDASGERTVSLGGREGNASGALLMDVNHDGHQDLVTASVQTGIFASVRALLNSTVEVQFSFYLGSNAKVVPDVPDFKRDLSFKFNIKSFTPYGFLPTLEGDFNGDGLLDAVYGKDQENLYIILQSDPRKHNKSYDNFGAENAFTLYPAQTSYKGTFPISDQFFIADLNGDHLSDMVFWYDDWQKRHEVLVLVNRYSTNH
jgi:hypothetical protein